jgi:hypothetical protein
MEDSMIDRISNHPKQSGFIIAEDGYEKSIPEEDPRFDEISAYLAEHPEALVPEPVPPEPSMEMKAMAKAASDEADEIALDMAWVREQRKAKP